MNKVQLCKGELYAIQKFTDGREIKTDLGHNIIVTVASELMAELARGIIGDLVRVQVDGIRTLAVGTGAIGWDLQNPPPETSAQTLLENELYRKEFDSVNYIDGMGGISPTRTNIIQLTTVFGLAEANGPLVEMGLFGGTDSLNTNGGSIFNYYTMPVINKNASQTLSIIWSLSF
jgi:hypothetical protein